MKESQDDRQIQKQTESNPQTEVNETQDQKLFMVNNIFEYDWTLESKGQLRNYYYYQFLQILCYIVSQINENLIWFIIDEVFFSLKTQEFMSQLQNRFNQISKIILPQNQLRKSQFQIDINNLILGDFNDEEEAKLKLKELKKELSVEQIIELLKNQKQLHEANVRQYFDNIKNHPDQNHTIKVPGILSPLEEKYLQYLEQKHINHTPESHNQKIPKNLQEDILCLICNDGDYQENNLIVICSKCNISVHQKCYGIDMIPQDDWICELCQQFKSSGKQMQCPLCPCKSGPLKPTSLKVLEAIKQKTFVLNNFKYHSRLKQLLQNGQASPLKDTTNEDGFYYDFNRIQKDFNLENQMPYSEFVWAHITCAKYTSDFILERHKKHLLIKFQKSDQIYHQELCHICKQKDCGILIKCFYEQCEKNFHLECARRNLYCFETQDDQKKNNVFCKQHTPLKLRRIIDQNLKNAQNQVFKFISNFESHLQYQKKYEQNDDEENINVDVSQDQLKSYQNFMMKLKEFHHQVPNNQFYVDFQSMKNEKIKFKIVNCNIPKKKERFHMNFKENDPIWRYFKYKKMNKKQLFKRYQEIIKFNKIQNQEYEENQKKLKIKQDYIKSLKSKQIDINDAIYFDEQQEAQDFNIYCICKSLYIPGQDMISCDMCENWFHYDCIEFIGTNDDAAVIDFLCIKCEKNEEQKDRDLRQLKNYNTLKKQLFKNGYPLQGIQELLDLQQKNQEKQLELIQNENFQNQQQIIYQSQLNNLQKNNFLEEQIDDEQILEMQISEINDQDDMMEDEILDEQINQEKQEIQDLQIQKEFYQEQNDIEMEDPDEEGFKSDNQNYNEYMMKKIKKVKLF